MNTSIGRRIALAVIAVSIAACSSRTSSNRSLHWTRLSEPPAQGVPIIRTVTASPGSKGWLLGGAVVDAAGTRQVAIWSSASPRGPWNRAVMNAVPGRDGPNETIFGIVGTTAHLVAFGYHNSPIEGYPRPSTWIASPTPGSAWQEILESREFFGGPDIVGFGDLTAGAHGYSISGTWIDQSSRPVISVWLSGDATSWTHDWTDPAFQARPGEIPLATGIADAAGGLLVVGNIESPTPQEPTREYGAAWFSATGRTWVRLGSAVADSTFDAVAATPSGWIVAGTVTAGAGKRPAVWFVGSRLQISAPLQLPGSTAEDEVPSAVDVNGDDVLIAGSSGGRAAIWRSPLVTGAPARWTMLNPPPPSPFSISATALATRGRTVILDEASSDESAVWLAQNLQASP